MAESHIPRRVVKVGGSLLNDTDFLAALRELAENSPGWLNVVIVGGGPIVDAIATLTGRHGIDDTTAHWLCIDAMSLNARWVQSLLPELPLVESLAELDSHSAGTVILDPAPYCRTDDQRFPRGPLPVGWDVTSDSIAARVADQLAAGELILWKSCAPPARDVAVLSECGFVDVHFPQAASELTRIGVCNLRDDEHDPVWLSIP